MPYNEKLAARIKKAIAQKPGVEIIEKMGGLSFMLNGTLLVRVDKDEMLIRCEPSQTEELLLKKGARRFEMKGKKNMKGWILVNEEGIKNQKDFEFWLNISHDFLSVR